MSSLPSALWRRAKGIFGWVNGDIESAPEFDDFQLVHVRSERFVAISTTKETRIGGGAPKYITVIDVGDRGPVPGGWVSEQIEAFKGCDTFQPDFLRGILFTSSAAGSVVLEADVHTVLKDIGVEWTSTSSSKKDQQHLLSGPHLIANGKPFELRRLHDDTQDCFVSALIQTTPSAPFRPLPFTSLASPASLSIAVPSRLQTTTTRSNNPLAGLRLAIKDNFHTAGTKTSLCNRAFHALYPPAPTTAPCIHRLVAAGATVVGKTKLASFAATEEPVQCVDWPAPWNPRGDGYQSPAGSSSGSGAAAAAYGWVDVAVGSDTSGSGRRPGLWNGCVAMRPSHGVLPMDGFVSSFGRFDVPTFFGRDLLKCRGFAEAWYGDALPKSRAELPVSIVVPTDYLETIGNEEQRRLIEEFVSDMEGFFGVRRRTLSLELEWVESAPEEAQGLGLMEFMKDACRNSFWYDDFHSMDGFRAEYEKEFGKKPYVSPPVRWQWDIASRISRLERDDAVGKLEVYRRWFAEEVMKVGQLNTIVVLPVEEISPRYRDEAPSRKFYPTGVPMLFLSPILRAPELTIPIGQVPYHSRVTDREEFLPVGVSLMASPGFDLGLMDSVLACLKHAKRPTSVQPGTQMFPHD